ncbi:bifunctional 2-polyprenyl-6-hydroxyphenol methylase/3-demethylubiquinol 3-O-methyltransferase UbiG [Streptomyces sp. VRA16 Mangrove soil]|uniref:class I SAM-dependent methyltransferase n=1 Tax=Streptomyces sp. VRA16 Mangrove soil TaxID=2817434 RepID=UPI001A9FA69E|nr:class I SAM-dependent methyltransferase [Streptomyces sp. VRA16 Mangrove soil]MBO1336094.1 methyltransferase domain-containing protein [Streptomyces sp. VRA16 Mangrove soil]
MTAPQVAEEVLAYYTDRFDEHARLHTSAAGVLELVRTQELLRRHLPAAPASVLDVGGGPGAHARWLVEDGYRVHLVDPVERHVREAAGAGCTVEVGDARALSAADASYDVVLLLGPLYHLPELADRRRALAEALRVVRPGGTVAVAGIQRHAALFDHVSQGRLHLDGRAERTGRVLATGRNEGREFTFAYFHHSAALAEEVAQAGFEGARVYGVEGPGDALVKAAETVAGEQLAVESDLFRSALLAARLAEPYPELMVASSHLLAFGRRPGQATAE